MKTKRNLSDRLDDIRSTLNMVGEEILKAIAETKDPENIDRLILSRERVKKAEFLLKGYDENRG
ncbi:hypothetical protein [Caudoviricetes sp.]|nr:hypothetical protein [Caudoviricetes sp.]